LKGKPEDTKLKLNLAGRDPDDGLNDIAYEKGALFLRAIELKVGRTAMDTFLNQYFNHFAFKTITTEQFLDYLKEHLLNQYPDVVKDLAIEAWVYGAGVPKNAPRADQDRFKQVNAVRTSFLESNALDNLTRLSSVFQGSSGNKLDLDSVVIDTRKSRLGPKIFFFQNFLFGFEFLVYYYPILELEMKRSLIEFFFLGLYET
jgi:aminopeptidase N